MPPLRATFLTLPLARACRAHFCCDQSFTSTSASTEAEAAEAAEPLPSPPSTATFSFAFFRASRARLSRVALAGAFPFLFFNDAAVASLLPTPPTFGMLERSAAPQIRARRRRMWPTTRQRRRSTGPRP